MHRYGVQATPAKGAKRKKVQHCLGYFHTARSSS
jgi:hypothetical protein